MKKGFFKRFWWLIDLLVAVAAVAVIVVAFTVKGGSGPAEADPDSGTDPDKGPEDPASFIAPEDERETDPEKIFVLTVDDFPGQTVVNLDDDPTTNFMVYQKGVEVLEERETLVSMDEEARVYVFEDPSDDLKNARAGDVLVIPLAGTARELAVLVDKTERDGDTLTVTGGELDLSELLSYADIDMDLSFSAEDMEFDPSGLQEGESVEFLAPGVPSDAEIASGVSPAAARTGSGPRVASPLAFGSPDANSFLVMPGMINVDVNKPGFQFTIPLSLNTSFDVPAGAGGAGVTASWGGSVTAGVRNIHVIYRVSVWNLYFRSMVVFDVTSGTSLSGSMDVHGDIVNRELVPITIPICGPIVLMASPVLKITAAVEWGGGVAINRTDRLGYDLQLCLTNPYMHDLCQTSVKDPDVDLYLSGSLEAMLGGKVSIGIVGVADVYGQLLGGIRLEGREAEKNNSYYAYDSSPDLYHACSDCIDGDLYAKLSLSVGYEIPLLERLNFGQELESGGQQKLPGKLGDFYFTKGLDSSDPEKWSGGLGLCPKTRFKTAVTLRYSAQDPVVGGVLEWYDTEKELFSWSNKSGEDGKAYIYLPSGEHTLTADCSYHTTEFTVTVDKAPTETSVVFEPIKPRLFVFYTDDRGYSSLIEPAILAICPDAILVDSDILQVVYNGYIYDAERDLGVKPGDMVLTMGLGSYENIYIKLAVAGTGRALAASTPYDKTVYYMPIYFHAPATHTGEHGELLCDSNAILSVQRQPCALEFDEHHRLISVSAPIMENEETRGLPYYSTLDEVYDVLSGFRQQMALDHLQPLLDMIAEIALGESEVGVSGGGGTGGGGGGSW